MSSVRIQHALSAFDDAWSHTWESVASALEGITAEEALWQHPAYSEVEIIEGEQLPGSVLWHVVHVEQCERQYLYMVQHGNKPPIPTIAHENSDNLKLMLDAMQSTHQELRIAISLLTDEDLNRTLTAEIESRYNGMSFAEFLNVVTRHNTWHAGQIVVTRRLYRHMHVTIS